MPLNDVGLGNGKDNEEEKEEGNSQITAGGLLEDIELGGNENEEQNEEKKLKIIMLIMAQMII